MPSRLKISTLTEQSSPNDADLVPVVDSSATKNKHITYGNLKTWAIGDIKPQTTAVTSNEIQNLNSSPKAIISAPGTGDYIWAVCVIVEYNWGSADYTGGGLTIYFTDGTNTLTNTPVFEPGDGTDRIMIFNFYFSSSKKKQ